MESYISPKACRGLQSAIHGRGLFAQAKIKKGEIVAVKGGAILTTKQLAEANVKLHAELQIADHLFVSPANEQDYDKSMMCLNHSCNPNVGMRGDIVFIAMRDIQAGEELTIDYALMDNTDSVFSCVCGSVHCRKEISGKDWKRKDIQEKYRGYFSAYLECLIANHQK